MLQPTSFDATKAKDFFFSKLQFTTCASELNLLLQKDENINIIDVRTPKEFLEGHIPGAINLPAEKWNTLTGLEKGTTNFLYDDSFASGLATKAAFSFAEKGFPVIELEGGFKTWKETGFTVEKETSKARV